MINSARTFRIFSNFAPKFQKKMKKLTIFLMIFAFLAVPDAADAGRSKRKAKARTTKVAKRKSSKKSSRKTRKHRAPLILSIHDKDPYNACEDTCQHIHGLDISHYQNEVFWEAVGQETNMAFVYLKCTEGGDRIDARYERNIELAHQHGLKVGSYHFFRPMVNLTEQIENLKRQCLPAEQDLIPMLDVESLGNLRQEAFCDSLAKFLVLMEEAYHQKPIVYTYRNFYNENLVGKLDDYQLWIAMYADEQPVLADGRDYTLWQYTSRGRIPGVLGEVDKNRLMDGHRLYDIRFQR